MSIINEALLVNLTIKQWSGTRFDRNASDWVVKQYNSEDSAARVNKRMVPRAFLKPLDDITTKARNLHRHHTLPWMDNGARMLPATSYFDYMQDLGDIKQEQEAAVATLLGQYDAMKSASKLLLGDMYDENDFPLESALQRKYSFDITTMPIPGESDWRVTSLENTDELVKQYADQLREITESSRVYLFGLMSYALVQALGRLTKAKRLHEAVINNISNACQKAIDQNIINDPDISSVAIDIQAQVASLDIKKLRDSREFGIYVVEDCIRRLEKHTAGTTEPIPQESVDDISNAPIPTEAEEEPVSPFTAAATFGKPKDTESPNKAHTSSPFFRSFSA